MAEFLSSSPSDAVQGGALPVSLVDIEARLGFLRKTYALFSGGVVVAAVGAAAGFEVLRSIHPLALIIAYLLAFVGVMALRKVPTVNVVALFGFCFVSGLLTTPLLASTLMQKGVEVGLANILTAFVGTTLAFGGLTAYVFVTRKDFSWMGGMLSLALFGMIGVILASLVLPWFGMSIGFDLGTNVLWNGFGVLLFSAFVLYDTSNILHNYAEDEYVMAALAIFLDFILIFKYLLRLLNSRK